MLQVAGNDLLGLAAYKPTLVPISFHTDWADCDSRVEIFAVHQVAGTRGCRKFFHGSIVLFFPFCLVPLFVTRLFGTTHNGRFFVVLFAFDISLNICCCEL